MLVEQAHDFEQRTGSILKRQAEARKASGPRKVTQQHVRQQARVDVTATQYDADILALEYLRMGHNCGEPRRASAFDHSFFNLQQQADGSFKMRLADQDDFIDQAANDFAGEAALKAGGKDNTMNQFANAA